MRLIARIKGIIAAALLLAFLSHPAHATQLDDGIAAFDRQDYAAALAILEPLAKQGSPAAQCRLGKMLGDGLGAPADIEQGIFWAKVGERSGFCYNGRDTYKISGSGLDYKQIDAIETRAREWKPEPVPPDSFADWRHDAENLAVGKASYRATLLYARLAESGSRDAQKVMGWRELASESISGDTDYLARANKWFWLAAEQGDAESLQIVFLMGNPDVTGKLRALAESDAELKAWMTRLYPYGGPTAAFQFVAGYWQQTNSGSAAPTQTMRKILLHPSAALVEELEKSTGESVAALRDLASLYTNGWSVEKDDGKAFALLRQAAQRAQTFSSVQRELAMMYYEGRGTAQDTAEAYYWMLKADRYGMGGSSVWRSEKIGNELGFLQREYTAFRARGWDVHDPRTYILTFVLGLLFVLLPDLAGLKFDSHRKVYICAFFLFALFASFSQLLYISPHSHDCWPCGPYGRMHQSFSQLLGVLVIFFDAVVLYQLVRRRRTFWVKPLIRVFSDEGHARSTRIVLLILNVRPLVWLGWFLQVAIVGY